MGTFFILGFLVAVLGGLVGAVTYHYIREDEAEPTGGIVASDIYYKERPLLIKQPKNLNPSGTTEEVEKAFRMAAEALKPRKKKLVLEVSADDETGMLYALKRTHSLVQYSLSKNLNFSESGNNTDVLMIVKED